jgi:hypothetical protein
MFPSFCVSGGSQQEHRRARRGETGRPVRPFPSTTNSKKKSKNVRSSLGITFMWPRSDENIQTWNTAVIPKEIFTKWAISYGVLWLLGQTARLWRTCMHNLPKRGHITHMCVPWDVNQRCVCGFSIVATENLISIFRMPERVLFLKHVHGLELELRENHAQW